MASKSVPQPAPAATRVAEDEQLGNDSRRRVPPIVDHRARRRTLGLGVLLVAMVFAIYAPILSAGFIWDDEENIVTNGTLRTVDGLRQMWFVPQSIQQYYPLM